MPNTTLGDLKRLDKRVYDLAVQRTKEAGNEPKDELNILYAFNYEATKEGHGFWTEIRFLDFRMFYSIYGKHPTYTESQIREACDSCVNNATTELIITKLKEGK